MKKSSTPQRKRVTTENSFDGISSGTSGEKRSRTDSVNEQIMKMLARTNNPFTFVEDSFFVELIEKAYPSFKLKGRQYFAETVLPHLANQIIKELKGNVSDRFYAITTDGWSAQTKPSPTFYR